MIKGFEAGELSATLRETKAGIWLVALLSAVLNILTLGGSFYMMMIYDSVLPSQSIPTLVGLLLMIALVYLFQAIFDILRSRMLSDIAAYLDHRMSRRVQRLIDQASLRHITPSSGTMLNPMQDFDQVRAWLAGPGPAAFMDLPWIVFFLIILSLLHYWLGIATILGALVMIGLTFTVNRVSKQPTETVNRYTNQRQSMADETRRHVEVVHSMGMGQRLWDRWDDVNGRYRSAQNSLVRSAGTLSGISRVFRMFLQSAVLTVGALLVIDGKATGGVIFASSILSARALAPIDQVIAHWKGFAATRLSWNRLEQMLAKVPEALDVSTQLPPPTRELLVENLVVVPPGTQRVTAQNINFQLAAGDALGVVGMSAAGKSSLAKALINIWRPARGSVRLDNAALAQWDPETLGRYIGYLPQSVELLTGTIAENIARFQHPPNSEMIVAAAQAAGVHDMIVQMPSGYDTFVGPEGADLSAGQRQRVGLARALYGDPFLIVLDEPNSNLDAVGETALDTAIQSVRDRGGIIVIIAHRAGALARCNYVLVMRQGTMEAFGLKDEIFKRNAQIASQSTTPAEEPEDGNADRSTADT